MYKDILADIGLNKNEALIYEFLIKNGESTAGNIIAKTPLKRGTVYNTLAALTERGIIIEKNKNKVAYFAPNHPQTLEDNISEQKKMLEKAERTLTANLSGLISDFNKISSRPGIKYYEGLEGVKKVIDDTLINNADKEILAFSDVGSYVKYLKKWNMTHYAPRRRELGIYEKVIIPDKPAAVEYMHDYIQNPTADKLTDILFINHKIYPFDTEINIYNGKVAFVTFNEENPVGFIITNKLIYQALRSVFKYTWNIGKQIDYKIQPEWNKE